MEEVLAEERKWRADFQGSEGTWKLRPTTNSRLEAASEEVVKGGRAACGHSVC